MLRFSANLSMLFGEYDFLARFEKAAQCGFRGVEFMFPYDYDIEELKQVLASNKLEHTLHNLPAGDWAVGERGIACIPGREEEFRDGVAAAIRGNDSNLLIVFYVQIMPDDLVMQLHRF